MLNDPPSNTSPVDQNNEEISADARGPDAPLDIGAFTRVVQNDGVFAAFVSKKHGDQHRPEGSGTLVHRDPLRNDGEYIDSDLRLESEALIRLIALGNARSTTPISAHVGNHMLLGAQTDDGLWDVVLIYRKGHPVSKSIRRVLRRLLRALSR